MGSAWANLSALQARPTYGVYVAVLRKEDPTPFMPESDEEKATPAAPASPSGAKKPEGKTSPGKEEADSAVQVRVDADGIQQRIVALPMPERAYQELAVGPAGVAFVAERVENQPGATVQRFDMKKRKAEVFQGGVGAFALSRDGKKLLSRQGQSWAIVGTEAPPKPGDGKLEVALRMLVDPAQEWQQIFEEGWRLERDFFYAPNLHGADWNAVHARYAPLVPYIRSREDMRYILDMLGGELSVGHSFTGGGDYPAVDSSHAGLLGADLEAQNGRRRITPLQRRVLQRAVGGGERGRAAGHRPRVRRALLGRRPRPPARARRAGGAQAAGERGRDGAGAPALPEHGAQAGGEGGGSAVGSRRDRGTFCWLCPRSPSCSTPAAACAAWSSRAMGCASHPCCSRPATTTAWATARAAATVTATARRTDAAFTVTPGRGT